MTPRTDSRLTENAAASSRSLGSWSPTWRMPEAMWDASLSLICSLTVSLTMLPRMSGKAANSAFWAERLGIDATR
jgi:hypothetical protein